MVILKAVLKAHLEDIMNIACTFGILHKLYEQYGWTPEGNWIEFAYKMERWLD